MSTICSRCCNEIPIDKKITCITTTYGRLYLCEKDAEELFALVNAAKESTWEKYFDLCIDTCQCPDHYFCHLRNTEKTLKEQNVE